VVLSPDAGVIFGKLNRVTDPAGCDQRSWQQPVLVEVVDVVEDGQRVNLGTLPSVTRVESLKSLNLPDPCWIDAAQVLPDRRSPIHGVLDAWEGGAPVKGSPVDLNQLPDDVVKAGAEVVEHVTEDEGELLKWGKRSLEFPAEPIPAIALHLVRLEYSIGAVTCGFS
jgi:hypothetical protein